MRSVLVWTCVFCAALASMPGCSRSKEPPELVRAREDMVARLSSNTELTNQKILNAMSKTPRQLFLPEGYADYAYADSVAGYNIPICSPGLVARALQEIDPQSTHRLLMVEPPSAYVAAVAARLCSRVVVAVTYEQRTTQMTEALDSAGIGNVEVHACDAMQGWGIGAPYHAAMICMWGTQVPEKIVDQISNGGTVVVYANGQADSIAVMKVSERELGTPRRVSLTSSE